MAKYKIKWSKNGWGKEMNWIGELCGCCPGYSFDINSAFITLQRYLSSRPAAEGSVVEYKQ